MSLQKSNFNNSLVVEMSGTFFFDSGKFIFHSLHTVLPTNCDPANWISNALAVLDANRMQISLPIRKHWTLQKRNTPETAEVTGRHISPKSLVSAPGQQPAGTAVWSQGWRRGTAASAVLQPGWCFLPAPARGCRVTGVKNWLQPVFYLLLQVSWC